MKDVRVAVAQIAIEPIRRARGSASPFALSAGRR